MIISATVIGGDGSIYDCRSGLKETLGSNVTRQ